MSDSVIQLQGIQKSFGANRVFHDISLDVGSQTVFGLVGLNGAGKTTLIRILLGLLRPDTGTCSVLGHDPWQHAPDYYRQLGVVLEHNGFWGNLTMRQNLSFFAEAKSLCGHMVKEYLDGHWAGQPVLEKKQKVKLFSRGEKMQCALCRAFLGWPRVYLFDEPAVALDVKAYDHFCALVRRAREKGATVLISSHQLDAIEDLCDRVGILENGTLSSLGDAPQGAVRWLVRAEARQEYASIIEEMTGGRAEHRDGAWRFEIASGRKDIVPAIISRLVAAGCIVEEVREEKDSMRESIRRHYGSQGT